MTKRPGTRNAMEFWARLTVAVLGSSAKLLPSGLSEILTWAVLAAEELLSTVKVTSVCPNMVWVVAWAKVVTALVTASLASVVVLAPNCVTKEAAVLLLIVARKQAAVGLETVARKLPAVELETVASKLAGVELETVVRKLAAVEFDTVAKKQPAVALLTFSPRSLKTLMPGIFSTPFCTLYITISS